jgi:hypothetical protein
MDKIRSKQKIQSKWSSEQIIKRIERQAALDLNRDEKL